MQLRLVLNTVVYILSVSVVIAAALNPSGTAATLRKYTRRIATTVRNVSNTAATAAPVVAAAEIRQRPAAAQTKTRELSPGQYRVAIGTLLPARLRTAIDSRTAQVNDQVDAVLTEPVAQDGVELIPSGSALHGAVVLAEPATKEAPRGRLEIVFTVVQHAETRSRAAIRTRPLKFEADAPEPPPGGRKPKRQPIDVVLPAGHPLMPTLGDALLVYVPTARPR